MSLVPEERSSGDPADRPTGPPAGDESASGELGRGLLGAGIAVTAWSTGTILAKYIDMGALAIGVYRFAIFGLGLSLWLRFRGVRIDLRVLRASMWGGIALGADIALFFSAVKETSIVNATVVGSLQPIVVGIVAVRFFGETIRRSDALWAIVALVGTITVVASSAGDEATSLRGDLLAVGALFAWSAYFVASRRAKGVLTPSEFTAGTSLWTAAICLPIGVAAGQDLSFPSLENLAWLGVMIVVAGIIGHSLMNWSLQRIPLWVGSTFTLFIPVASSILAWIILDEPVSAIQAVAMAGVIGALAVIVRGQTKTPAGEATGG
ncbi:MAG: DMT family transporter [Actinomycetota bacterium]